MKTKMITATAFSLLLAVGAANAQSTSDGQISNPDGSATTGAPASPDAIDPSVTNSTTEQSTTGDTGARPDCAPAGGLTEANPTPTAPQQNADGSVTQTPEC